MLFRYLKNRSGLAFVGLLSGAIFLLAIGGVTYTNRSEFCSLCHTMEKSYNTWIASSHKEVRCVDCHIEPGIGNFIEAKVMRGGNDLIAQIFNPPDPGEIRTEVSAMVCIRCHMEIRRISEIAKRDLPEKLNKVGLIMEHKRHLEAFKDPQFRGEGEGCRVCHSKIVHGERFKGYPIIIPPEKECFRCHDGKRSYNGKILSKKCSTCHTQEGLSDFLFDSEPSKLQRDN